MAHRVDHHHELLEEHLVERGWTPKEREILYTFIGHSALQTAEGVLNIYEYQQVVDEQVQRRIDHDNVFINRTITNGEIIYRPDWNDFTEVCDESTSRSMEKG